MHLLPAKSRNYFSLHQVSTFIARHLPLNLASSPSPSTREPAAPARLLGTVARWSAPRRKEKTDLHVHAVAVAANACVYLFFCNIIFAALTLVAALPFLLLQLLRAPLPACTPASHFSLALPRKSSAVSFNGSRLYMEMNVLRAG